MLDENLEGLSLCLAGPATQKTCSVIEWQTRAPLKCSWMQPEAAYKYSIQLQVQFQDIMLSFG
jgi:hypothetical protein